jgi:AcrR family transcriptional regulator
MSNGGTQTETQQAIMEATYQALGKHGYPATSIAKIADEFPKSKSLLYYHYEDKQDLLGDFVGYLLNKLEDRLAELQMDGPSGHLQAILDLLLPRDIDTDGLRFRRALLEIRSQAPYHEEYHEHFERSDSIIIGELTATIESGIDTGVFRPTNARETAEFLYSMVYGILARGVALEDKETIRRGRDSVDEYIKSNIRRYS